LKVERLLWVESTQSHFEKAAVQDYLLAIVGYLRNTCHSHEPTSPAVKAEYETVRVRSLNFHLAIRILNIKKAVHK